MNLLVFLQIYVLVSFLLWFVERAFGIGTRITFNLLSLGMILLSGIDLALFLHHTLAKAQP